MRPLYVFLAAALLAAPLIPVHAAPAPQAVTGLCGGLLLDVYIMLDASGSMASEIDQFRTGLSALVADISTEFDARFGLIVFGFLPDGEAPILTDGSHSPQLVIPLSSDTGAMQARLDTLSANGFWEPWADALWILNRETAWRPDALRMGIVLTDEPVDEGRRIPGPLSRTTGNDYNGPLLYEEIELLRQNSIRVSAIDSGIGLVNQQLAALTTTTGGRHVPYAHGSPNLIPLVRDIILETVPAPYRQAEGAGLLVHQNIPANPLVSFSATHAFNTSGAPSAYGSGETFVAVEELTHTNTRVYVLESYSGVRGAIDTSHAHAEANATRVSLLGGVVTAGVVHVVATADHLTGLSTAGSYILDLRIMGTPVPVSPGPATYAIPGVGALYVLPETTRGGDQPAVLKEGLRLEIDTPALRQTIVVAQAHAMYGCAPVPEPLTAWRDNDAGTHTDAGSTAATAIPLLLPEVVAGRIGAGDAIDTYSFTADGPGRALSITLKSSERVRADFDPLAQNDLVDGVKEVSLTPLRIELVDPTGSVQETHDTTLTIPRTFEFNPHIEGTWLARVRHDGAAKVNYTLGVVQYVLPRIDGEGSVGVDDAPATCGAGPLIARGQHNGGLYGNDLIDNLRVQIELGEDIVALVKPSENVDGARFHLRLLDPTCAVRAEAVWDPTLPEGAPRAVTQLAADRAGLWNIEISRQTDAVGNWHLTLGVVQPMPAAMNPDGGSGTDAPSTHATAMPMGDGTHQGRLSVGDDVDCYRFPAHAGEVVAVAVVPTPGLDVRLVLRSPTGETVESNYPASAPEHGAFANASMTGAFSACVHRLVGGGQYSITMGAAGRNP